MTKHFTGTILAGVALTALVALCPTRGQGHDPCESSGAHFCGSLSAGNVEDLRESLASREVVNISSTGGDSRLGLVAAHDIKSNANSVRIFDRCDSTCVEVLLPAFDKIEFVDEPVVAVHGSVQMIVGLLSDEGYALPDCYVSYMNLYDAIIGDTGSATAWRAQIKKLGVHDVVVDDENPACPEVLFAKEVDYWLPDSGELQSLYGLEFQGDVASDHPDRLQSALDCRFQKGTSFRVGEAIYYSEGQGAC